MYTIDKGLYFNDQLVGLRLCRVDGYLFDLDIDRLGKSKVVKERLNGIKGYNLIEHEGQLMTPMEAKGTRKPLPSVPETKEYNELIKKTFLVSHTIQECQQVAEYLFKAICNSDIVKAVPTFYVKGKTSIDSSNAVFYRLGANLKTRHKFQWNEDHEYCERHYDAYGVIDNDPIFTQWENYANSLRDKLAKETGLMIRLDLEGIKYELTLDLTVYSVSLLDPEYS